MICANCRHVNPTNSLVCQQCNAPLAAAPAPTSASDSDNDSPFGDFLPTWMSASPAQPAAPRQTGPLLEPGPTRPTNGTGALNNSTAIDALLKQAAIPAAPASASVWPGPAVPAPEWNAPAVTPATATNGEKYTNAVADPTYGLPVPDFAEPPLWHKLPANSAWAVVRLESDRETPLANKRGSRVSLAATPDGEERVEDHGPEYGVDRGFYFFTDDLGYVNVHALAGVWPRIGAALLDAVITAVLGVIFYFLISWIIVNDNWLESTSGVYLAAAILPVLVGFLYHTVLVGIGGQTVGHRKVGIKVIKRGGRAVGIVSGIVRALYGIVPSILISLVGYFALPQPTVLGAFIIIGIDLLIYALAGFGLIWCVFDQAHQGLHDKLADTYVVSVHRS